MMHLLTHWSRVRHICVGNLTIIGSDNGLLPGRRQAIIWTNAGILLIGPLGTNFSEILIEILTFSFKKTHLKMLSGKWWPSCLGLNVLSIHCPACRTTFIATRFRVAVICPIIPVPHCIRVFFYFVWFVFINHIFQFYYELCTYCNILDIYLSWNLNFVNYVLFYMKLLNYLFFSMFGSVLESCELTGVCLLLPWLIKWK